MTYEEILKKRKRMHRTLLQGLSGLQRKSLFQPDAWSGGEG